MTTTNQEASMPLLDKAEQILDAVYIQAKETIKAQREMISQSIERIEKDEEMDEEERKSFLDFYIEDCKLLMKSIQDFAESIERGKGEMEKNDKERRKKESEELYAAVNRNEVKKVKSLLKKGIANVDWQNKKMDGCTVLMFASVNGHLEICKLLIEAGAKVNLQENRGYTALYAACQQCHLEICKLLVEAGAQVDLQTYEGTTALYIASEKANLDICKLLIKAGAKVDLQRNDGAAPLFTASLGGHLEICKLLIKAKACIDLQTNYGDTALSMACYDGHQEIASFLLAEGAAYTFNNDGGKTAGDLAVERHGWNWNAMIAEANLSFFDHLFDCMVNADYSPEDEKKIGRKRKRVEEEVEKKETLPFLLRFMKQVYFSDIMMSKHVFPKLSFNAGAEAGEGKEMEPPSFLLYV